MQTAHYQQIRCELIRAIRGKLSQERVSQRMGFRSNPVHKWEQGQTSPDWLQFIKLCQASKRDIQHAVHYILGFEGELKDSAGLLRHLLGSGTITELSHKLGHSRFKTSKWLSGKRIPSIDLILEVMAEFQFILVEFITALVPANTIPSLEETAAGLRRQKEAIYQNPVLEGILCCLALDVCRKSERQSPKMIAELLGLSSTEVLSGLAKLEEIGLVHLKDGKYLLKTTQVDTQGDFFEAKKIRKYWGKVSLEFIDYIQPPEGGSKAGYFLIDLSSEGEKKALEAYYEYCFKLRAIAQNDIGIKKTVKFYGAQIIDLLELGRYRRSASNS